MASLDNTALNKLFQIDGQKSAMYGMQHQNRYDQNSNLFSH